MLSLQNSKTFSSDKEDRKGEEDNNDYPADLNEMQRCNYVVILLLNALAIWTETVGTNTGPLIPTQLDTLWRSLICPQSGMLT